MFLSRAASGLKRLHLTLLHSELSLASLPIFPAWTLSSSPSSVSSGVSPLSHYLPSFLPPPTPGSVCPLLMTFCFDFWSYAVVCVMFGVSLSAWPALSSTMLVCICHMSPLPAHSLSPSLSMPSIPSPPISPPPSPTFSLQPPPPPCPRPSPPSRWSYLASSC